MNRRKFIKTGATGAVAIGVVGPAVLMQFGCGGNVMTWADQVINAFMQAQPIIRDLLPGSVALLAEALTVAKDLRDALKNNKDTALEFLQKLIAPDGLFNRIADDVHLISNESQRRIVAGILALASIALNLIAAQMQSEATPALASAVRKAKPAAAASIGRAANDDKLERALKTLRF